jgi:hypothetical protein
MSRFRVFQDALCLILLELRRSLVNVRRHIVLVVRLRVVGANPCHEVRRLVQLGAQLVARLLGHVEDRQVGVTMREAVAEVELPLAPKESAPIRHEAQRAEQHEQGL